MRIAKAAVRRLFIERQHLDGPRLLSGASLARFVEDAGGLQIDTINVLDRAHYLTLFSRFGVYDKAALDRLVYQDRVLYEYWAHAACFVAAADLPFWRRAMLDYQVRHTGWSTWLKRNPKVLRQVEAAIKEKGPLSTRAFERPRPKKSEGWWDWKPAAHALQYLWMTGRVAVVNRKNFAKQYDLAERAMPGLEPALDSEAFRRWHLKKSLRAMGAASGADLGMYLTFPRYGAAERRKTLAALVESGEVARVQVDGEPAVWFARAEDLPALEKAASAAPLSGTTLLSPFDSFLWHRERTRVLFGFDYRIEVYVPGPKRVHGYYSLPIFHDGRLIGRLDPKNHRAEKRLEIHAVHFEKGFAEGKGLPAGLRGTAQAVRRLADFVGAKAISLGKVFPARLDSPLRRSVE